MTPVPGVIPYTVNVSLYADRAQKQRFMIVPPGEQLHAPADGSSDRWDVPVGTYFVKTFFFPNDARDLTRGVQLVETRFLVRDASGYRASTYLWNADQTDAFASGGNVDVSVRWIDEQGSETTQLFHVPGTSYCQNCHDNRALGIRTRQMDLAGVFPDGTTDQLDHLVAVGVLDVRPAPGITLSDTTGSAPIDQRARSYLDADCSHCHAETGAASSTHVYFGYEQTDPTVLDLCRTVRPVDGRDHVIVPGDPDGSEFLARMESTDPFVRMPLGPIRVPDGVGIAVLSEWVASLPAVSCP